MGGSSATLPLFQTIGRTQMSSPSLFDVPPSEGRRARLIAVVRGGTASVVVNSVFTNVLRIVSSMTLTRLLSSEAFGAVGVVMSVSLILAMLSDVGLYPFIVRHQQAGERRFLDEVWTLRLVRSAVLTLLMAAAAWPAAIFMGKPELAPILLVYSLSFLIEGFSSLAFATAVREQRLWRLTMLESLTATIQLAISITIALVFRSTWSLVLAMLASGVVRTILSYLLFPGAGRRPVVSRSRADELWQFSRFIAVSSFLSLLILQADKLVLARLMPLAVYGHYVIAATLATAPIPLAWSYSQRVLYPAYAEAARAGGDALTRVFYAKRRWAVLGFTTAAGLLVGSASLVVRLLYDPRYVDVGPLLSLLSISTMFYLANHAADEALIASGRPRWTLYGNIVRVTWLGGGGTLALIQGDPYWLVAVVGFVEVVAAGAYWIGLRRIGVLRVGEELLGFAVAGVGVGLGWTAARTAAAVWPIG